MATKGRAESIRLTFIKNVALFKKINADHDNVHILKKSMSKFVHYIYKNLSLSLSHSSGTRMPIKVFLEAKHTG